MNDPALPFLFSLLALLIALSAFFSSSETALMSLNRYRLAHQARSGVRWAKLAQQLLGRPDRLIGLILLGNIAVNSFAATLTTLIGLRLDGEHGALIASGILTPVLLIISEVAPKTFAALHPDRVARPAVYVYSLLRWPLFPLVWVLSGAANILLRLVGVHAERASRSTLSRDELRAVVAEAGAMIPQRNRTMLLSILDLEQATVEDIMMPRNEIEGLDIEEPLEPLLQSLIDDDWSILPVFRGSVDDLRGVISLRALTRLAVSGELNLANLLKQVEPAYFVPKGTSLHQQLLNFQQLHRRFGFVVDEYGDIVGLVRLEDIIEEVVGDFGEESTDRARRIEIDADGSAHVGGQITLRNLNRATGWRLPTSGPKTLNGLVIEQLEEIPQAGRKLDVAGYDIEITEVGDNTVKAARILPRKSVLASAVLPSGGFGH